MFNRCCVLHCDSRRKDVKLYKFPKAKVEREKWLECINCEKLRSLSLEDLCKQHVCQKHFEKRFLTASGIRSRLRIDAYPSLFTDHEIASGLPHTTFNTDATSCVKFKLNHCKKRQHEDHTYCEFEITEEFTRTKTTETEIENIPLTVDFQQKKDSGSFNIPACQYIWKSTCRKTNYKRCCCSLYS